MSSDESPQTREEAETPKVDYEEKKLEGRVRFFDRATAISLTSAVVGFVYALGAAGYHDIQQPEKLPEVQKPAIILSVENARETAKSLSNIIQKLPYRSEDGVGAHLTLERYQNETSRYIAELEQSPEYIGYEAQLKSRNTEIARIGRKAKYHTLGGLGLSGVSTIAFLLSILGLEIYKPRLEDHRSKKRAGRTSEGSK